jgi:hypothetical protein
MWKDFEITRPIAETEEVIEAIKAIAPDYDGKTYTHFGGSINRIRTIVNVGDKPTAWDEEGNPTAFEGVCRFDIRCHESDAEVANLPNVIEKPSRQRDHHFS